MVASHRSLSVVIMLISIVLVVLISLNISIYSFMCFIFLLLILSFMFLGKNHLYLKRDFLLISFIAQSVIYLLIAPTIIIMGLDNATANDYLRLQTCAVILFVIPLIVVYKALISKFKYPDNEFKSDFSVTSNKVLLFTGFIIIFELLFLYYSITNDMIFRRIGTYEIALKQSNLGSVSLLILRSHDIIALPIICYLIYLIKRIKIASNVSITKMSHRLLKFSLILTGSIYTFNALLNSRFLIVSALILVIGILSMFQEKKSIFKIFMRFAPFILVGMYIIVIIGNIRIQSRTDEAFINVFNPTYFTQKQADYQIKNEWVKRLDGIDLMQKMEPSLYANGFEYGRVWKVPVLIALTQYFDSDVVKEYKASARTSAKTFLMEDHTSLDPGDYNSCMLVDLFGNFNIFGFLLGGVAMALLLGMCTKMIINEENTSFVFIGMILASHFLIFERDFIDHLVGWIKYIPITVVILMILPVTKIKKQRRHRSSRNTQASQFASGR